jgi:hypothetical protein
MRNLGFDGGRNGSTTNAVVARFQCRTRERPTRPQTSLSEWGNHCSSPTTPTTTQCDHDSDDPNLLNRYQRVWYLGANGIAEADAAAFKAQAFTERWREQQYRLGAILYERD